ncbi:hypothetical protein ACFQY5_01335 [Paeniroseomonas aquatica]|uniref:hypothetical protein n=1 Tax=Paeniroseomonas aquatica TaxID=373043 RepID=UPI0036159881
MTAYHRPGTLAEALALLAAAPAPPLLLAGARMSIRRGRGRRPGGGRRMRGRCSTSRPSPDSPASRIAATTTGSAPG